MTWLVWSDFFAFQVFRSSSLITCRRNSSSRLWATSCATGRGSMFAMTTSASVSVPTSIPSATVPSPTSRSWRKLCWGCLKLGLPLIKTLRPLVRRKFPPECSRSTELLQMQRVHGPCCSSSRDNRISITNVFSATDSTAAQSCTQCEKS